MHITHNLTRTHARTHARTHSSLLLASLLFRGRLAFDARNLLLCKGTL
jgi:hypothetical protein